MAITDQIRDGLREIDIAVANSWNLGKNMAVGWAPHEVGIQVCIAPSYRVLGLAATHARLLNGPRMMDDETFGEICKVLRARPIRIALPFKIGARRAEGEVDPETVDTVIRRYSIVRTDHRAVMMFEITDFSKASPVEQIARLNSLEYSINNAAKKLADAGLPVELARSTAGDGFHYVWNRFQGFDADLRAYAALLLILMDNALAHRHAGIVAGIVPVLRACFSIGSHYAYHQVEGTKPRTFEYVTGEVTITLARLINKAQVGQILIGNFQRPIEPAGNIDALLFLARAEYLLQRLSGAAVDDHVIKEVHSIVTSGTVGGVAHPVVKYVITDKHGYHHEAFNVRAKIRREGAELIELGLRPEALTGFDATTAIYQLPATVAAAG